MRLWVLGGFLLIVSSAVAQDTTPPQWVAPDGTYRLNPDNVSVTLTARRFLMSPLEAAFGTVEGNMVVLQGGAGANQLEVVLAAADLTANGPIVEGLLAGEDFLNAEAHPQITFRAEGFEVSNLPVNFAGNLTMAGVTHPITLESMLQGYEHDLPTDEVHLIFVVEGELDRRDWGMVRYRRLVANTVRIRIEAGFVRVLGTD